MPETLRVEVVFALPDRQLLLELDAEPGSTAGDVILRSGIREKFPDTSFDDLPIGVWGRRIDPDYKVRDGDRIEIYRSLAIDPREARRRLAASGRTMGQSLES